MADCSYDTDIPVDERIANAALIARAPELAAENERLRGLLAECVANWREEIEQWRASGQPQYAMALERCVRDIEARQEAPNAK